ncbi:hypothetical protein ACM0AZ_25070 [Mycobacteroides abscessus subsp. massiliense]|uniref:hypothetical protein n=1 Tax=Mycobacteroides abscessus TaxID=36809 RepID=UPI00092C9E79|nr:hypothetical protein [Mycobacteroides abscessus]MBN7567104.1 hypothetical protein [Mycobacteroides abscessus subsp. massiliense]SIJ96571.1 Uncharacterised protein [Mycobacteroides abscessus subsp. abscessus]SLC96250.1 Uncharacterised protein [Mycobacteroides abscessus subsp. massiliense]SLF13154.1 Uncharacterised protein [Mycobacteroides abscessus subsp. massiliense]SLF27278.1 Uncharacterised protein [Mycobacteroides abscessus subsp. massiliense]
MTGPNEVRVAARNPGVRLADITLLVRVPDNPAATMGFTDDQADDAALYAAEHDGILTPLPVHDAVWDWNSGQWIGANSQVGQTEALRDAKSG